MFQIKHTSLTMPACGSKKGHLRPKTARGARNANSAGLCRGEGRRTARRRVILARAQGLRAELNPPSSWSAAGRSNPTAIKTNAEGCDRR